MSRGAACDIVLPRRKAARRVRCGLSVQSRLAAAGIVAHAVVALPRRLPGPRAQHERLVARAVRHRRRVAGPRSTTARPPRAGAPRWTPRSTSCSRTSRGRVHCARRAAHRRAAPTPRATSARSRCCRRRWTSCSAASLGRQLGRRRREGSVPDLKAPPKEAGPGVVLVTDGPEQVLADSLADAGVGVGAVARRDGRAALGLFNLDMTPDIRDPLNREFAERQRRRRRRLARLPPADGSSSSSPDPVEAARPRPPLPPSPVVPSSRRSSSCCSTSACRARTRARPGERARLLQLAHELVSKTILTGRVTAGSERAAAAQHRLQHPPRSHPPLPARCSGASARRGSRPEAPRAAGRRRRPRPFTLSPSLAGLPSPTRCRCIRRRERRRRARGSSGAAGGGGRGAADR